MCKYTVRLSERADSKPLATRGHPLHSFCAAEFIHDLRAIQDQARSPIRRISPLCRKGWVEWRPGIDCNYTTLIRE